jgi:membrane fusion protein, multidrug efflux system
VSFSVPAEKLPEIQRYKAQQTLTVRVLLTDGSLSEVTGDLIFIDNAVNQATGTILLKARFDNAKELLWPGQFVDTALILTIEQDCLVVPSSAVQTGQEGAISFVIKPDMTVEKRIVNVRRTFNGFSIIDEGIAEGEQVVTDGQLRLLPGSKVEIKASIQSGDPVQTPGQSS